MYPKLNDKNSVWRHIYFGDNIKHLIYGPMPFTRDGMSVYQYIYQYADILALFEKPVIGIGKSQDRWNIGYLLSALAKFWWSIEYRLSVSVKLKTDKLSVIGNRLWSNIGNRHPLPFTLPSHPKPKGLANHNCRDQTVGLSIC